MKKTVLLTLTTVLLTLMALPVQAVSITFQDHLGGSKTLNLAENDLVPSYDDATDYVTPSGVTFLGWMYPNVYSSASFPVQSLSGIGYVTPGDKVTSSMDAQTLYPLFAYTTGSDWTRIADNQPYALVDGDDVIFVIGKTEGQEGASMQAMGPYATDNCYSELYEQYFSTFPKVSVDFSGSTYTGSPQVWKAEYSGYSKCIDTYSTARDILTESTIPVFKFYYEDDNQTKQYLAQGTESPFNPFPVINTTGEDYWGLVPIHSQITDNTFYVVESHPALMTNRFGMLSFLESEIGEGGETIEGRFFGSSQNNADPDNPVVVVYKKGTTTYTTDLSGFTFDTSLDHIAVVYDDIVLKGGSTFELPSDVRINAYYNDGRVVDVTSRTTITGYNMSRAGTQSLTASYTENGTTYTVNFGIIVEGLKQISIDEDNLKKEYLVGEEFSFEGAVVTATYINYIPDHTISTGVIRETTRDVTADVTVSGYDTSSPNSQQYVTVTYTDDESGMTASTFYYIAIYPDYNLESITLSQELVQMHVGSDFSYPGIVTAHYADGKTANVTSQCTFTYGNLTILGDQTVTVSYTEDKKMSGEVIGSITKEATFTLHIYEDASLALYQNGVPQAVSVHAGDTYGAALAAYTPTLGSWPFAGWSMTSNTESPSFIDENAVLTDAQTLYALFEKGDGTYFYTYYRVPMTAENGVISITEAESTTTPSADSGTAVNFWYDDSQCLFVTTPITLNLRFAPTTGQSTKYGFYEWQYTQGSETVTTNDYVLTLTAEELLHEGGCSVTGRGVVCTTFCSPEDAIQWYVYGGNELHFVGEGSIADQKSDAPWYIHYSTNLTSVVVHGGITGIGKNALSGLTNVTLVSIPESVTSIGEYAFSGCEKLESISLPDGIQTIGFGAFNGSGLTSITLPASLTSMGDQVFRGCSKIEVVDGSKATVLTAIPEWMCYECQALTSVTLPNGITTIGEKAFFNCKELTSITLPEQLTSIGAKAFYGCEALTSIEVPEGVMAIGENTFYYCNSLKQIDLPSTIQTLGNCFFYAYGDNTDYSILLRATTPPTADADASTFSGLYYINTNIYVPENALEAYETAWGSLLPNSCKLIGTDFVKRAVNITTEGNGTVTCSSEQVYSGASVTITMTPGTNYRLGSVTVNGIPLDLYNDIENNTYTFSVGKADVAVNVTFASIYHVPNIQCTNGTCTFEGDEYWMDGNGGYMEGHYFTISYTPNEGYILQSLIINGVAQEVNPSASGYGGYMPEEGLNVQIVFAPAITVAAYQGGVKIQEVQIAQGGKLGYALQDYQNYLAWYWPFAGWSTTSDCANPSFVTEETVLNANTDLYGMYYKDESVNNPVYFCNYYKVETINVEGGNIYGVDEYLPNGQYADYRNCGWEDADREWHNGFFVIPGRTVKMRFESNLLELVNWTLDGEATTYSENTFEFTPTGDCTVGVVTRVPSVSVTLGAHGYATICYDVNLKRPEGLSLWYLAEANGSSYLQEYAGEVIPSENAFLIKGTPNATVDFELTNEYVDFEEWDCFIWDAYQEAQTIVYNAELEGLEFMTLTDDEDFCGFRPVGFGENNPFTLPAHQTAMCMSVDDQLYNANGVTIDEMQAWAPAPTTKTTNEGGYATWYAGYSVEVPEGVNVWCLHYEYDYTNWAESFKLMPFGDAVIPAKFPVLIEGEPNTEYEFNIYTNTKEYDYNKWMNNKFEGTLGGLSFPTYGNRCFMLSQKDGEWGFYPIESIYDEILSSWYNDNIYQIVGNDIFFTGSNFNYNVFSQEGESIANMKMAGSDLRSYNLAIGSTGMSTLFLDHDALIPEGIKAYTATTEGTTIVLKELKEKSIPMYTAVVLRGTPNTTYAFNEVLSLASVSGNELKGVVYQATYDEALNEYNSSNSYVYVLSAKDGTVGFYHLDPSTGYVPANKAFLLMDKDSFDTTGQALSLTLRYDDGTTWVDVVEQEKNDDAFYDMQGRRVLEPQQGIYIVNGKKVLVK